MEGKIFRHLPFLRKHLTVEILSDSFPHWPQVIEILKIVAFFSELLGKFEMSCLFILL